jgi:bifunctional non-homologous end joining protein LigD
MVEDHPLEYASFEGTIPAGEYGAGQVIVWDTGEYVPDHKGEPVAGTRAQAEEAMLKGIEEGKLSFTLKGEKLKGSWALVQMRPSTTGPIRGKGNNWLLIKHNDQFASIDTDILDDGRSVLNHDHAAPPPGARQAPFPETVGPMLATLTDKPFNSPDWLFEPKLDGIRAIVFINRDQVRLQSRNGIDITPQYPSLSADLAAHPSTLVLDGEIIALDKAGRACFQCLRRREKGPPGAEVAVPVYYYVFDILYRDGYDLRQTPLVERRRVLVETLRQTGRLRLVEQFENDGETVFQASIDQGFEGVVAKRRDSLYQSGRTHQWLKVKATLSDEFVIAGYTVGAGSRAGTFGALVLGYHDGGGRLVYAGNVGTGFDETAIQELLDRLKPLVTPNSPFPEPPKLAEGTVWTRPVLVAEVKYAQYTADGRLRQPSFLRLRDDKTASEVTRAPSATTTIPKQDPPALSLPVRQKVLSAGLSPDTPLLEQLKNPLDAFTLEIEGHQVPLSHLSKILWPAAGDAAALTKRDLLLYLARVAPFILSHLKDRPVTMSRYPGGIGGEHFWQRHWENALPPFVETVDLHSEQRGKRVRYLLCNNLASLTWLGHLANLEIHAWFSRVVAGPSLKSSDPEIITDHPDFIIFDIDPYIYSGQEKQGEEPALNRRAFSKAAEAAGWVKEVLDSLGLPAFVKTSGKTGLHVHVPIKRQYPYTAVRSIAHTISLFVQDRHPADITTEWSVEKRAGKIFLDWNQNVRGKTLACAYSPRPSPDATVSTPLRWDELGKVYPTDFTINTAPERFARLGDLWEGILDAPHDLESLLKEKPG